MILGAKLSHLMLVAVHRCIRGNGKGRGRVQRVRIECNLFLACSNLLKIKGGTTCGAAASRRSRVRIHRPIVRWIRSLLVCRAIVQTFSSNNHCCHLGDACKVEP